MVLRWLSVGTGRRTRLSALSTAVALLLTIALPSGAGAATISSAWQAKIGSGGANGTTTIVGYTSGTGLISAKLVKMRASTLLPITLRKGTCSGTTLMTFSIKTTSSGAASGSRSLTASQVTAIKNATKGTAKLVVRIGSSTTGVKCGTLTTLPIAYVAANITVGKSPSGVAIAANGVWVTNWWDNNLSRIDPATNTVLQNVPLTISGNGGPEAIAFGENSLWVTVTEFDDSGNALPTSLLRVDPVTGTQQAAIPIGRGAYDVAVSPGAVWVPLYDDNAVVRIDTTTNTVTATIPVAGNPVGIAFGAGAVWVTADDGHVARIDPATSQVVASIQVQDTGGYVAATPTAVWVTSVGHVGAADGTLTRIDPATNQVIASVTVGAAPWEVAVVGDSVWVGLHRAATVVRVSATTNVVLNRVTLAHPVYAIAAADHVVWAVQNLPSPDANTAPPAGMVSRISY